MNSINHVNERAIEQTAQTAEQLRCALIQDVFDVAVTKLHEQNILQESDQDGLPRVAEYYVLEDVLGLPFIDDEPQDAVCILLTDMSNIDNVVDGENSASLLFFIPIQQGTDLGSPDELTRPLEIAVRRTHVDGVVQNYLISAGRLKPFVSAEESGEQDTMFSERMDDLADELLLRILNMRSDTGIATIAKLREDFVNFRLTPQKREIIES